VSDPAAGQGGNRSNTAQTRHPARQSTSRQAQKSTLGLTPMTAKPQGQGRSPVADGRPAPPAPAMTPKAPRRPARESGGPPSGLTAWIRRRRTRAHLGYLPKWTARRTEPFEIGGLHWLPVPSNDNRGPSIALHGGESMLLALAEMSPAMLRGPESANLGARLAEVLTAFAEPFPAQPPTHGLLGLLPGARGGNAAAKPSARNAESDAGTGAPSQQRGMAQMAPAGAGGYPAPGAAPMMPGGSTGPAGFAGPGVPGGFGFSGSARPDAYAYRPALTRIQILHQVPGSAGRTRSYLVLGFSYSKELVDCAARLGQGERGLTILVSRAAETVFAMLSDPGPRGGRLGTLVPLDRAGWTRLLGALVLPGRGDLVVPQSVAPAWRPTEIDALAPRYIAVTAPIGTAGQSSTWWHATGWVKRWPQGLGGLDVAACAGFLPPGVTGAASVVMGLRRSEDRTLMPTVAGYLTVSGHDAVEVELARVAAHAAADARDGFVEFCDRNHHLAFADTLPLARGLAG
jgi:hypothetical protein